jgi:PAS domain S-box-containing protein
MSDAVAEAILSTQADAIVAANRDGIIGFWNPGAVRLFGYSHEEAMSRSLDLIVPERLRQRHWDGYRLVMETGKSRYGQGDVLSVPAVRKDGATISVEFTIVPLQNNGHMVGIIAIMRDVTRRFDEMRALKQSSQSLQRLRPKSPEGGDACSRSRATQRSGRFRSDAEGFRQRQRW